MSDSMVLTSARIAIALTGGLISLYMYRKTRIDQFRSDMFALRDEMFDYIWKNNLSYDLPIYLEARRMLNTVLRFAHRITITSILFFFLARPFLSREIKELDDTVFGVPEDSVAPEIMNYFKAIEKRALKRIAFFAFIENPLVWPFLPFLFLVLLLPELHRGMKAIILKRLRSSLAVLEAASEHKALSHFAWHGR